MGYLTAKQFSEKWNITERRIIKLCQEERINGAIKNGMVWLIPEDTMKPADKRNKIAKYINTQKRVVVVSNNNEIGNELIPLLKKDGYIIDSLGYDKEKLNNELLKLKENYYDGLVVVDNSVNQFSKEDKEKIIEECSKRMNCEASIVIVENEKNISKLETKLSERLKASIGVRINTIKLNIPLEKNIIVNYQEIAIDIFLILTKFKNTTGITITTDGGYLEFNKKERTNPLETGKFYQTINTYFKTLNKEDYLWCVSTMMEDEWTDEPLEMQFRVTNLEVANRGTKVERIFIFSKDKIKEFKDNKTLQIYMQSNIHTMFVDYDKIIQKNPELLKIVENGWDGINNETLIMDLPSGGEKRGYISKNKEQVKKAYHCFQELKKYSKDLKEVLKR